MSKMTFKRGDDTTHFFIIPSVNWTAGGTLFFAAKPVIDDDNTDAAAVINQTFTDTAAVDDGTNVTYTLDFPASATNSIASGGKKSKDYLAEFQYVTASGKVVTYPGNDKFIDAIVYFDVRRSTT